MVAEIVEQQEEEELTPGQRLKAARTARSIERNDIARWLKLDEKLIRAIEENDEEHLPEPVFIAGYIRSYAKLVELSPDQLIKDFTKSHELSAPNLAKQPEAVPGRMAKVAESLPKRFSVATNSQPVNVKMFVTVSVAIVLVGVVSWVMVFTGDSTEQAAIEQSQVANTTILEASPAGTNTVLTENQNAAVSSLLESKQSPGKEQPQVSVPLELKKKERIDPGVVTTIGTESEKESMEEISVRFNAESWVDIRDGKGKMLLRSLGVAGATKEVRGVGPFQVLIGYGPGVEITYNGSPYDFSKFQGKQEVARFTLDASSKKNKEKQQN